MYDRRVHDTILKNTFIRTMKGFQYATHGKYAYDTYNSFTQNNMAPIGKRRNSMSGSIRSRPLTIDYDMFAGASGASAGTGGAVRDGQVKGRSRKLKPCRIPVKVSRKFKSKVLEAVASDTAKGKYTVAVCGSLFPTSSANLQTVTNVLGQGTGGSTALQTEAPGNAILTRTMEFFCPDKVLDAASVLFNGKVSDVDFVKTTTNFDKANTIIQVPYQSVDITFRNNTQVIKEIEFYQCTAKSSQNLAAVTFWTSTLAAAAGKENLASINVNGYYASPGQLQSFSQSWNYSVKTVTLDPGQSAHIFMSQKDQCYDWAKFQDAGTYPVNPKGKTVSCFYIVRNKEVLANLAATQSGHPGSGYTAGYTVTCEIVEKYVIEAPEISEDVQKFDKFYMNVNDVTTGAAPYSVLGQVLDASTFARVDVLIPTGPLDPKK